MTASLLELDNLSCSRGGLVVLAGLQLQVAPGEAHVLRGPNGSGKTTLLRTIAGLQPAVAGEARVDPEDIAYAAHADAIKPTLTVAENLTFWAQLFGQYDITPALDAFDLESLKDRRAGALSAGQKRRLGLSRMCVTGRALWLMDEPTVSLDARAVAMFANAVRAHLAGGGAALIATHIDLGLEAQVFDLTPFKPDTIEAQDFDEAFL
ncbi:MAG: heme ABC exporter ATP-binding protein CcmA [Silicimonas sp.]|nr:heme ABC exporter ATP-binding protein CcmA [Silicimonas sp.]